MKKIRLLDIIITEAFANSHPSDEKVQKYRKEFAKTGKQSKFLVINKYNVLMDGYIQYLILKENGIEEAEYIRTRKRHCNNYRYEILHIFLASIQIMIKSLFGEYLNTQKNGICLKIIFRLVTRFFVIQNMVLSL